MTRPSQSQVAKVRREPEVHTCAQCGKPNAPCGTGGQWFCAGCVIDVDPDYFGETAA